MAGKKAPDDCASQAALQNSIKALDSFEGSALDLYVTVHELLEVIEEHQKNVQAKLDKKMEKTNSNGFWTTMGTTMAVYGTLLATAPPLAIMASVPFLFGGVVGGRKITEKVMNKQRQNYFSDNKEWMSVLSSYHYQLSKKKIDILSKNIDEIAADPKVARLYDRAPELKSVFAEAFMRRAQKPKTVTLPKPKIKGPD